MNSYPTYPNAAKPLLSILLPAYYYSYGIIRALTQFTPYSTDDCEIYIFDDSLNQDVELAVKRWSEDSGFIVTYKKNRLPRGAVPNWNELIRNCRGEYCLLMHQDEFPIQSGFISSLLAIIKETNAIIDVYLLDCVLTNSKGVIVRPHLPRVIRKSVVKHLPEYMLRRNVIGPASCLLVRRELYPIFDEQLKWFVDVDAYFRLRQSTIRWYFCNDLKIGSEFNREDSITASIKTDIKNIEFVERKLLINKYPNAAAWIDPENFKIRYRFENAAWITMRVVTIIFYSLRSWISIASLFFARWLNSKKNL